MNAAQSPAEAMWIEYIKTGEVLHRTTRFEKRSAYYAIRGLYTGSLDINRSKAGGVGLIQLDQ